MRKQCHFKELFPDTSSGVYGWPPWSFAKLPPPLCRYCGSCVPCWTGVVFVGPNLCSTQCLHHSRPFKTASCRHRCVHGSQGKGRESQGEPRWCSVQLWKPSYPTFQKQRLLFSTQGSYLWKLCLLMALCGDKMAVLWLSLQKYKMPSRQMNSWFLRIM